MPNNAHADYKKVEWSSDKPEVATVDASTGKVTAIAPGQAKITATAKNGSENSEDWKTASVSITVIQVTLNKSTLAINTDQTEILQATVLPNEADQTVRWSSNDENVATVDQNGIVTAKALGEATITATAKNGLSASCKVYVCEVVVVTNAKAPKGDNMTAPIVVGPVKLQFSTLYSNHSGAWFPTSSGGNLLFMATVTPADGSNIQIQKCVFRYNADSAEVTEEPFKYRGWTPQGFPAIGQVDVYFTRNS